MAATRPHTPPELVGSPFHLRDGLAAGLTRHQLASTCWVRLFREVYVHRSVPITDRCDSTLYASPRRPRPLRPG